MDLISIIIPVYKVEKYLEQCMNSVLQQTYRNIEIILIDDGSPDRSGLMCDEYAAKDSRVKVVHKTNGGVSAARNKGLEEAAGDWILFVDSDDWIESDGCEVALKTAMENNSDIVMFDYTIVTKNKSSVFGGFSENFIISEKAEFEKIQQNILSLEKNLFYRNFPFLFFYSIANKLYRKKILEDIFFCENVIIYEDADFFMQALESCRRMSVIAKSLYNYRFNDQSAVHTYQAQLMDSMKIRLKNCKEFLDKQGKTKEFYEAYYRGCAYASITVARNFFSACKLKDFYQRKRIFTQIFDYQDCRRGIENYHSQSMSIKVVIFLIKRRLYFPLWSISRIYNIIAVDPEKKIMTKS
jgi:glycosyltransferase involved in cell wall biosynthesis